MTNEDQKCRTGTNDPGNTAWSLQVRELLEVSASTFASVGCTGTARVSPVFVDLTLLVRVAGLRRLDLARARAPRLHDVWHLVSLAAFKGTAPEDEAMRKLFGN